MKPWAAATRPLRQPALITVILFRTIHDFGPVIQRRYFAEIGTIIAFFKHNGLDTLDVRYIYFIVKT
jgi:hypothetical protein